MSDASGLVLAAIVGGWNLENREQRAGAVAHFHLLQFLLFLINFMGSVTGRRSVGFSACR